MYKLEFNPGWDVHYAKMDNSEKERIWKKIQKRNCIKVLKAISTKG